MELIIFFAVCSVIAIVAGIWACLQIRKEDHHHRAA